MLNSETKEFSVDWSFAEKVWEETIGEESLDLASKEVFEVDLAVILLCQYVYSAVCLEDS